MKIDRLKNDHDVGYCRAYHLVLGHHDAVIEVSRMASDIGKMQHWARDFVKQVKRDEKGTLLAGRYACRQIDFRT